MQATSSVTLRLPPELHEQVKERADEKDVSMNTWMVRALVYALAHKGITVTERRTWSL